MNRLFRFKELNDSMNELYLQNGESTLDGEISPLFSEHLDCLPKVLMIEAEFDYFKICNEEFVKKLEEQGDCGWRGKGCYPVCHHTIRQCLGK
jgi:acetyl esterase/lipase